MDDSERSALWCSTRLVGAVALGTVLLTGFSYALWDVVVTHRLLGSPDAATMDVLGVVSDSTFLLAKRVLPLVVVVAVGVYLTAVRELPTVPALAGAFLGGLVAAVGQPLVVGAFPGSFEFLDVALLREFARWTARIVVPAMTGVLLGAAWRNLRRRRAKSRRSGARAGQ